MVVFLTSSFITYQRKEEYSPKPIDASNHFAENLKKYWVKDAKFLFFASNPADAEGNDHAVMEMLDAFSLSGFSISQIHCFDDRCENGLKDELMWADIVYLAGGHAPTQNAFMKRTGLKELLWDKDIFDGLLIGLSAGALNLANEVYLIPEEKGESIDSEYIRFTDGLGFTDINIVPHIEYEKTVVLDGKKLIDEIVIPDSIGRIFYLIPDGSYFMIRNGITEFFGSGAILENGLLRPLYSGVINTGKDKIEKIYNQFETMVSDYYDWILQLDVESGNVEFFYISKYMQDNGIVPANINNYNELCWIFSSKLVVNDEKQPVLEQASVDIILKELELKGSYARTIHIETSEGIKAFNMRANRINGDKNKLLVCLTDISMILDHDWMTDEYSRSGFLAKAELFLAETEDASEYSIVYTNILGFKAINEVLGSSSGDMIIFIERDVLWKELSPVLIARLESDHFAVITKTSNLTEEKLDKMAHQTYVEESIQLPFLIRFGIYNIDDSTNVQYMLDNAKLAENSISNEHREYYAFCDEKMRGDYVNQRVFVSELDKALANGEFMAYFQPVVDARTEEIVSAEALIRWNRWGKGLIPPGQFIPVFEKEGSIAKLDSFMVDSVIEFNDNRMTAGKKVVPCAVNLSRVDFYDTKLLAIIEEKVSKMNKIGDILKLEVTESAYSVLEKDAFMFLEHMHTLGLSLMLDDFGSGMSSLSTLESFEFDVIKLDMGFIAKIGKSKQAEAVIKHTIGLAHDIGAKIVAEGAETEEQVEFLKAADCDMIQGYYYYKPMPMEEFAKLLDQ